MKFISMDHDTVLKMQDGQTRIIKGQVLNTPPKYITFKREVYITTDPDEIAFLRARPSFGTRIIEGVAPDDMVVTEAVIPMFTCTKGDCKHVASNRDAMKAHRLEAHPRKKSKK